jgi:chloramphenicol 3-O phosphotransferase
VASWPFSSAAVLVRGTIEVMPEPGRVFIVNGASSAGKSTLIAEFVQSRADIGDCWIAVGIDDFMAKLPWQWFDIPQLRGPFGPDGIRFEGSPDGMVPTVGHLGRRLFAVYRRVVATWARSGFNVVVDEVTFDREAAMDWSAALTELPVSWIGIRCDPDEAAARERTRGDPGDRTGSRPQRSSPRACHLRP